MNKLVIAMCLICVSVFGWANMAISFLKKAEDYKANPYIDAAGKAIGYGFNDPILVAKGYISKHDADKILASLVLKYGRRVDELVENTALTNNQFAALVIFYYNVGDYKFRNSTLLKCVNMNRLEYVPFEFRRWVYGVDPKSRKKVKLAGLINRREAEIALWLKK